MRQGKKYRIRRMHCGYETPRYVTFYEGQIIGADETKADARKTRDAHKAKEV